MSEPRRFVLDESSVTDTVATLTGGELHHLRDVLRLQTGDEVTILDPRGREHRARLREISRYRATADIIQTSMAPPRTATILAAAVIKGPRMDFIVEKAVELGAAELWPILTARTQVRALTEERIARWRRLAAAAAKQSKAPAVMIIGQAITLGRLTESTQADTLRLICDVEGAPMHLVIRTARPSRLILLCGPEGGFDPEEIEAARRAGYIGVTLGPNRMRAETAAIAALSIAGATIHELGTGD
jgi:16S rRNA (uracil1498-N3)-methyltransferase